MSSASFAYINLSAMDPQAAQIVQKHKKVLQEALEQANQFWTQRNIRTLESKYNVLATELHEQGYQALLIKKAYRDAIIEIQRQAIHAEMKQTSLPSRVKLMSQLELESHASDLEHNIYTFALQEINHKRTGAHGFDEEASKASLLSFESSASLAKAEKSLYFGLIDLAQQSPLDKGAIEIDVQPKKILLDWEGQLSSVDDAAYSKTDPSQTEGEETPNEESSFLFDEETDAVDNSHQFSHKIRDKDDLSQVQRYFLILQRGSSKQPAYNSHLIQEIHDDFSKRISLHHKSQSTALYLYRLWIMTLEDLQIKLERDLSNPIAKEMIEKTKKELVAIHKLAHEEYLAAYKNQQQLDQLCELNIKFLYENDHQKEQWIIYNAASHRFQLHDQKSMSKAQAIATLVQIEQIVRYLSLNYQPLVSQFGKDTPSIGKVLNKFLRIMDHIESTFVGKSFFKRELEITTRTKQKLATLCATHLQSVIKFCQLEGERIKKAVLIEHQFAPGSAPLFYLELASDLDILGQVIPARFEEVYCRALTMRDTDTSKMLTAREVTAENSAQRAAMEYVRQISHIDNLIQRSGGRLSTLYKPEQQTGQKKLRQLIATTCQEALIELQNLDLSSEEAKDIKKYTLYFFKKHPEALFYLEMATKLLDFGFTFKYAASDTAPSRVISFDSMHVAFITAIADEYRLNIRPHLSGRRHLVELASVAATDNSDTQELKVASQEKNLHKLQNTFTEMLIMGLRFYHSSMHVLSSFLEWPEEALQEMFTDHLVMLRLKGSAKYKGSKKSPTLNEFKTFKAEIKPHQLEKIKRQALQLTQEFQALLNPYRTLQIDIFNFFSELSNLIQFEPNYLVMDELQLSDIAFIRENAEQLLEQYGQDILNPSEKNAIATIIPLLDDLQTHMESGQEISQFFLSPTKAQGDILALKGVNPLTLKIAIQVLRLAENSQKITHLNLSAFNQLFDGSLQRSSWQTYANATISFTMNGGTQQLQAFCDKYQFTGVLPTHAYAYLDSYDKQSLLDVQAAQAAPAKTKKCPRGVKDYSSALQPIVMLQDSPNQYFLKWPLFTKELEKRVVEGTFEKANLSIREFSEKYNEAKRTLEKAFQSHS